MQKEIGQHELAEYYRVYYFSEEIVTRWTNAHRFGAPSQVNMICESLFKVVSSRFNQYQSIKHSAKGMGRRINRRLDRFAEVIDCYIESRGDDDLVDHRQSKRQATNNSKHRDAMTKLEDKSIEKLF